MKKSLMFAGVVVVIIGALAYRGKQVASRNQEMQACIGRGMSLEACKRTLP